MSMNLLAIETSCDESSIALIEIDESSDQPQFTLRSHITLAQIDTHREYGGVFPALAKRDHALNLTPILKQVLTESGEFREERLEIRDEEKKKIQQLLEREPDLFSQLWELVTDIEKPNIDRICVTNGPGLEPALWVGVNFAKALGMIWDIPVTGTNHMEGHVFSALTERTDPTEKFVAGETFAIADIQFPILSLLISGGHTELVLMHNWGQYEKIGATRDDAVGEAFDKVARIMGLPYPGGPEISKLAEEARNKGFEPTQKQKLPRPMLHSDNLDFSFSGLKTAVRKLVGTNNMKESADLPEETKQVIAMEFENAATEVLMKKVFTAVSDHNIQTIVIAGGVSANRHIRRAFQEKIDTEYPHVRLLLPARGLTGDNALMIALAGYFRQKSHPESDVDTMRAQGNLSIDS